METSLNASYGPEAANSADAVGKRSEVLVVNMDSALLRTDLNHERLLSLVASDWRSPLKLVQTLWKGGRSALRRLLQAEAEVMPDTLPYDDRVIAYVQAWRTRDQRTALVSETSPETAEAVSAHLGLFDAVLVAPEGQDKAALLEDHFSRDAITYLSGALNDVPVWERSAKAVTINAPAPLKQTVEQVCKRTEHLSTRSSSIRPYLKALRPHQWLKNLLVFLPMFAAHQLTWATFGVSLAMFVCFSLMASSVYVTNDLLDLEADRAHPRKRARPFAAGQVPILHGIWMAAGLLIVGMLLAFQMGPVAAGVVAIYFFMTTLYSIELKRRMVIDICVLAALYTMRIIAGGVAAGIPLSVWLLAFSIFFFLSLAAVKRQAELVSNQERGVEQVAGRDYRVADLPIIAMIAISAGYVSVLVAALYINSPDVATLYSTPMALWTVCAILLYWITRIVLKTHRGEMLDDPVVYSVTDRTSQLCLGLIIFMAAVGVL